MLVDIDIYDDAVKQIEHGSQSPRNNDSFEIHHISDDDSSVATDAGDILHLRHNVHVCIVCTTSCFTNHTLSHISSASVSSSL